MVRTRLYLHCLDTKYAPNVSYPNYSKYIYSALLINVESRHLLSSFSAHLTAARIPMLTEAEQGKVLLSLCFIKKNPLQKRPSEFIYYLQK